MNNSFEIFDHSDNYIEIGYNIAYYRKHAKMTQEQLAEKVGISRSHISAIEAPNIIRKFSLDLLFSIADVLEIEVYNFLFFIYTKTPCMILHGVLQISEKGRLLFLSGQKDSIIIQSLSSTNLKLF